MEPSGWRASRRAAGRRRAVTVGNFDGVHRGHQALVAAGVEGARAAGGTAVVLTFDPHPTRGSSIPARAPAALMTLDQKAELLGGLGRGPAGRAALHAELARSAAEEFARAGPRRRAGRAPGGGRRGLPVRPGSCGRRRHARGPRSGAGLRGAWPRPVLSSTGAPSAAPAAYARPSPEARSRARRRFWAGRSSWTAASSAATGEGGLLGIPTANVEPVNETLPAPASTPAGARDRRSGEPAPAVVNVGRRPTFGGGETTVEAHVLDFDGDLYGRRVRLAFLARLRDERRFPARRLSWRRSATTSPARGPSWPPSAGTRYSRRATTAMSELHGRDPGLEGVILLYPQGLHQRPHRAAVRGRDPEGARAEALQDRRQLRRPHVHRQRRPRGHHGGDRGDPAATAATSGSPASTRPSSTSSRSSGSTTSTGSSPRRWRRS